MSWLEELISNTEQEIVRNFKDQDSSTLNAVLQSYHHFIVKYIGDGCDNASSIQTNLFTYLTDSISKNNDPEEIIKICNFYSSCVEVSHTKLALGSAKLNDFLSGGLMEVFDDFTKTYLCLKSNELDRSLFNSVRNLSANGRSDILINLFSYIREFKDHPLFGRSCEFLENNYHTQFEDIFKSYLIKLYGFMQPISKFEDNLEFFQHHEFVKLNDFNNRYMRELEDNWFKYEINYSEMVLLQETEEIVSNYCMVLEGDDDFQYPIGFGASEKLFFYHLNYAISLGETMVEKHQNLTYWCKEVQRMVKSGTYGDELKLMFGGVVR